MFCLSKPDPNSIRAFLSSQGLETFSYSEVGTSCNGAPRGYTVDHNRIALGTGSATFELAKNAIRHWKMFEMPWITLCWPAPIEVGATVAVLISHYGFWSLNAARIVYVIDDPQRYGFAYGTLRQHGEIGEERFTVELSGADQSVWYDLYSFSRPNWAARLGYPFARTLQKRFAKESKQSMLKAVGSKLAVND